MKGTRSTASRIAVAMIIASMAIAIAGCAEATKEDTGTGMKPGGAQQASSMPGGMKVDPNSQNCAACTKGETAPPVAGAVETVDGVQMIDITIKDGTYVPNRFTATASAPVTVNYTVEGKPAIACLSKPTIKQLDKTVVITSGTSSADLGTLTPGTYDLTCGMGRPIGQIVVQ